MRRGLCIGGPYDGEFHDAEWGTFRCEDQTCYSRLALRIGDNRLWLWVHESLTLDGVLTRLVERYAADAAGETAGRRRG